MSSAAASDVSAAAPVPVADAVDSDAAAAAVAADVAQQVQSTGVAVVGLPMSIFEMKFSLEDRERLYEFLDKLCSDPASFTLDDLVKVEPALEVMQACYRRIGACGAKRNTALDIFWGMADKSGMIDRFCDRMPKMKNVPSFVQTYVREERPEKRAAQLVRVDKKRKRDAKAETETESADT